MTRILLVTLLAIPGIVTLNTSGAAQPAVQAQDAPVAYVASVKRSNAAGPSGIRMQPGSMAVNNMPIRPVIRQAYGPLQDVQLLGGPDWLDSDRFTIEARLEELSGGPAMPATMAMMRQLLAERFQLKVHRETRELPIYELVLARRDGGLGPALRPSTAECVTMMTAGRGRGGPDADGRGGPPAGGNRGAPPPDGRGRGGPLPQARGQGPGPLGDRPPCGSRGGGFGEFRAGGTTMAQLAMSLSPFAQRMVVDKTGLTDFFDVDLSFTPAADQLPPGPPPPGAPPLPPIDPTGPSLFTALQEQLGLKLESQRGPVDVLVIDHMERPTED